MSSPTDRYKFFILLTFKKLVTSIKEAGKIKANYKKPSRIYKVEPPEIKSAGAKLAVSQNEFAMMMGVSVRPLQNKVCDLRRAGDVRISEHG